MDFRIQNASDRPTNRRLYFKELHNISNHSAEEEKNKLKEIKFRHTEMKEKGQHFERERERGERGK
jgi:hypothetical protein